MAALGELSFQLLVERVRDYAIFMLDVEGRVLSWNAGAELIKGYRPQDIIGQSIEVFYPPEDRAANRPRVLLARAEAEGRVEDEGWRLRKDGTRFWANVVITPIRDSEGTLAGFAKVTRDLTEQRQAAEELRRSEERFRLLVEGVGDYAIFMLDPAGRVATWNAGAQRLKGYTAAEIVGQSLALFYDTESRASGRWRHTLEVAAREGRHEDEGWRVRKDGTRFWANAVVTALRGPHGELRGFAKVTRDLTERRRLEEERVRLAQTQEAVRLRDEFLSIASHELKTPLTALQLQLEGLKRRVGGDAKLMNKVVRASRDAERITDLVETLLDVSRIATGHFELQPRSFDLAEAVNHVLDSLRETAAQARCTLVARIEAPLEGVWDRLRLEQVTMNLLSNALRYGAGAPVEVTLRGQGDDAVLEVSDHGPGVAPGDAERIFGRFERASSLRHYGGLGLGLYVAREIAAAHGGAVTVENLPAGGARFTVRVPRQPAMSASAVGQIGAG